MPPPFAAEIQFTLKKRPRELGRRLSPRVRFLEPRFGQLSFPGVGVGISARLLDLAPDGIGFSLGQPLALGCPVLIRLARGEPDGPLDLAAEVAYSIPLDETTWRIGCRFRTPLDSEELADMS